MNKEATRDEAGMRKGKKDDKGFANWKKKKEQQLSSFAGWNNLWCKGDEALKKSWEDNEELPAKGRVTTSSLRSKPHFLLPTAHFRCLCCGPPDLDLIGHTSQRQVAVGYFVWGMRELLALFEVLYSDDSSGKYYVHYRTRGLQDRHQCAERTSVQRYLIGNANYHSTVHSTQCTEPKTLTTITAKSNRSAHGFCWCQCVETNE